MRLLLDTHAFLWWLTADKRLSVACYEKIRDAASECVVSAASIWEIAIKMSIGKLKMPQKDASRLGTLPSRCGFDDLPVTAEHAAAVRALPLHHADPFDRLLIVRTQLEGMNIVTADSAFDAYAVATVPTG